MDNFILITLAVFVVAAVVVGYLLYRSSRDAVTPLTSGPESEERSSASVEQISREIAEGAAVLLDVRTDDELRATGYAKGSMHFDSVRIEDGEIPDIDRNLRVYVYCRSGGRAGRVKAILEQAGFRDVVNIGGLRDWKAADGELEFKE